MPSMDQTVLSRADFSCYAPEASSVFLVGRFDQHKLGLRPMSRNERGEWSVMLELPPGRYLYKFLVMYRGILNLPEDPPAVVGRCNGWN